MQSFAGTVCSWSLNTACFECFSSRTIFVSFPFVSHAERALTSLHLQIDRPCGGGGGGGGGGATTMGVHGVVEG